MKQLLSRLSLGVFLVALLFLSACEKDNFSPTETAAANLDAIEVAVVSEDGISQNVASITGAEMIAALKETHGNVADLPGDQLVKLYFDERAKEQANVLNRDAGNGLAQKSMDVYSTFITATIIPSITSPPSTWTTFYETSPPIVGLPTANSTRTLQVTRCPNFFQLTTTANAYLNGVGLSNRSDTESNNPTCGGRQIRSFAQATLFTNGSATTQANVSCLRRGPFCAIAVDPVPGPIDPVPGPIEPGPVDFIRE